MTEPTEDVNVPKLGPVNKKIVIGIVIAAGLFLGFRWWQARSSGAATSSAADTATSDFATSGLLPGVAGAVNTDGTIPNAGGGNTTTTNTGGTGPGHFANNAEWSAWVTANLPTDKWTGTDIVTALGAALAHNPTDMTQQQIVQAAIALGGEPPEGPIVLVGGGQTGLTVAPSITGSSATATSAKLTVSPVAGASGYLAYRSGVTAPVGESSSTDIEVDGLKANTSYGFQVAAMAGNGSPGPKSATVTVKTPAVGLATPTKPTVTAITQTSANAATRPVPGADGYNWTVSGVPHGHSAGPAYTLTGLKHGTGYTVTVAATLAGNPSSKFSTATTFKTK